MPSQPSIGIMEIQIFGGTEKFQKKPFLFPIKTEYHGLMHKNDSLACCPEIFWSKIKSSKIKKISRNILAQKQEILHIQKFFGSNQVIFSQE